MQIVYVVTSSGRDIYSAMTRVSVASIRLTNPQIKVTGVCDAETDRAMRSGKDPLLDEVDEWVAFETPPGPPAFRNRFLKTSLRGRIGGPYLFLDSDTIIRDDISPVFKMPGDLAAAPNHSRDVDPEKVFGCDSAVLDEMNWMISPMIYVNGGVLWVTQSEGAHRFYRLWHEKWRLAHQHLNNYRDQPALNSALFESGVVCTILSHRYNAQIKMEPSKARDAAIWHYYSSEQGNDTNSIDRLVQTAAISGSIDITRLRALIQSQAIWPRGFWATRPGLEMIRCSARDLSEAVQSGQDTDELFQKIRMTDPVYARSVLMKTWVDAYWSEMPKVHRFARSKLIRHFPQAIWAAPVRRCWVHGLKRQFKSFW